MYIRLSSLRQTRFGYADSAFCLSFFLPIFLFIYNMLNNLKSVTLFPIFLKKIFIIFLCPPDDMPQDAAATRRPFFSGKAGIGELIPRATLATNNMRILNPAIQPDIFNMLKNPKNVTLFAKKIKK